MTHTTRGSWTQQYSLTFWCKTDDGYIHTIGMYHNAIIYPRWHTSFSEMLFCVTVSFWYGLTYVHGLRPDCYKHCSKHGIVTNYHLDIYAASKLIKLISWPLSLRALMIGYRDGCIIYVYKSPGHFVGADSLYMVWFGASMREVHRWHGHYGVLNEG